MVKWGKALAVVAVSAIVFSGCSASPERALTEKKNEDAISAEAAAGQAETELPQNADPALSAPSEGANWQKKLEASRPVAVMIDNFASARPQAGLKDAEIVIEALAEGNITRYMAFFFSGMPESVGPIRSARPYFIDRAMEFNAIYVHVGGSPKALSDIKKLKVADLDGLVSSQKVFFRKKHKKMPHNLYSTMDILRNESVRKKYDQSPPVLRQMFTDTDTVPSGEAANFIGLPYRQNDGGYVVSYLYSQQEKMYQRQINGKLHADEIDSTPIQAKNIIVQIVPTQVVDDKGRLDLELVGSGKGWWLSNGVKVPITWKKSSRSSETIYSDSTGNEIKWNPGPTWIQIIPKSMTLDWEQ